MKQPAGICRSTAGHTLGEGRLVMALAFHQLAQCAAAAQQAVDLARHIGAKADQFPFLDDGPFRVGPRQDENAILAFQDMEGPKDLGLFAAHDIRLFEIVPLDAGHDADSGMQRRFNGSQMQGKFIQCHR